MTVWHLIATMRTEWETLEQTAENFKLPREVVVEALRYYTLHKTSSKWTLMRKSEFSTRKSVTRWSRDVSRDLP